MYKQVIKLGGSSQTDIGYHNLLDYISKNQKTVIVLSAIKGITNNLIKLFQTEKDSIDNFIKTNIIKPNIDLINKLKLSNISFLDKDFNFLRLTLEKGNLSTQDKINIISLGETFTSKILLNFLKEKNVSVSLIDSVELLYSDIENASIFNNSKFNVLPEKLNNELLEKDIIIVPGFRGKDKNNNISLMSRGGSDTTGSLLACGINANIYQIWTDVNGLKSSDPSIIENSKVIKTISYDAAQEVAAMGAKILHPFCIKPCKEKGIPIKVKNTYQLDDNNTSIEPVSDIPENTIYCISNQENVSVIKVESLDMWNNYGFVYNIFSKFKDFNIDVNIINTSQFDITTTTDEPDKEKLMNLKKKLEEDYQVEIIDKCNIVSIVGENIKKYNKINMIMQSVLEFDIKLTSYSSNDMTLSFVVEKGSASNLINKLHSVIFPFQSFKLEKGIWWENLLNQEGPEECKYIYNMDIINQKIKNLKSLDSIDRIYYAMKANNNNDILNKVYQSGLGFETVTLDEIYYLENNFSNVLSKINLLYTPNFAKIEDFKVVFNNKFSNFDIKVIVDNINLLIDFPEVFKNKKIGLRLDLDYGFGHCSKVVTQGQDSKFGMTPDDIINNIKIFEENNIKIIGLHSHMGSGINDYNHWVNNLVLLKKVYLKLPKNINNIEWIDIGGGFGLGNNINFDLLNLEIFKIKSTLDNVKIFIEPGRYIVAESGIIWGKVTQTKYKNNTKFIGTNIGMTDIMRPVLYSSVHPVYFKENENKEIATIVGPICESGDILVKNLEVPKKILPNDSVIIADTGAYGIVMASNYNNRRLPEQEII